MENHHAPTKCPVCGENMLITKLNCPSCKTDVSGEFAPCRFCTLDEKSLNFIETFLRCRGSIKEVERVLGVSYPTVKNMMETALTNLGLNENAKEIAEQERLAKEAVLEKLQRKEIDVETALREMQSMKGD